MKRAIPNDYRLPNGNRHLTPDEIRRAIDDFEYFMGNFQQIINKGRETVPFKLNEFQKRLFSALLPMVKKETRLEQRHHVVVLKPRQVGASVGVVAFINYICAFVDGMENLNILHVFPVGDTVTKFYKQKVMPIISGVHPSLYPTMEYDRLSSSLTTKYVDTKGARRNNYYEIIASSANSIRSATVNVVLEDEIGFYRHPERLDSAIMPALPAYGFSLVVYLSTFENHQSNYFHQKILTALKDPDDWTLIFIPWYLVYPERSIGLKVSEAMPVYEEDKKYAKEVILPALKKDGIPKERWGDCIDWYFRQKRAVPNMKFEFPTTIDEVLDATKDKGVFDKDSLERQKENVEPGMQMRLITDNFTKEVKAQSVDENEENSPFRIFREPVYGHKYKLIADPITSINEETDTFAMIVMDDENLEQVAVFQSKNMPLEDYADYAVSIAKIYNNAIICPESNMAAAFTQAIYNIGYRNLYYEPKEMKKKLAYRTPGVRTTASSKEAWIDILKQLLITDRIKLHDAETISELETFVKKTKEHRDGSVTVKMMAQSGALDDLVACLWCYVATLSPKQLSGTTRQKWTII